MVRWAIENWQTSFFLAASGVVLCVQAIGP